MQRIDIDKIKAHIERNKKRYIIGGAVAGTIALALITRYVMRRSNCYPRTCIRPRSSEDVHTTNLQAPLASTFVSGTANKVNNNFNFNYYVGNANTMSKIVSCNETGEWFKSQADAAREYHISESALSKHLNKGEKIPGSSLTFKMEGIAA